ncbi:hypothetical protein BU16DRAFT_565360 [Lophium mytilinum]|uniref:Zn(2)-C6 fungal-type domain-containing protein n=1 Tax=Lophium mytilinum TaxID=390894 RepID=A0A6A6QGW8_9PEZI|nr:hypothetical protein BU16DRAFT_565360 [Lophium mytilinum]
MAADGGRLRTARATQACVMCKTRKKKCNKSLPSCGYCIQKELDCVYALIPRSRNHATPTVNNHYAALSSGTRQRLKIVSSDTILSSNLLSNQTTDEVPESQVYSEVHGIIRATGQFVDDISARYFQDFHRHLPIISRIRFYNNLITLGVTPAADFSVLLLTICLITHAPALGYQPKHDVNQSVKQQSLYLPAKSLFAQVQVSCSSSIPLIQAGLLLAIYEYTHGRAEDAFVTIAGSARMAYAARIHARDNYQTQMTPAASHNTNGDILLQAEEAANTWWGIVIYERAFFSEAAVLDQPLVARFPGRDPRLPIESHVLDQLDILEPESLPNIPVSCLTSLKVGGFGRTAQATCLLDQVLKGFDTADIDSRLLLLDRLDTNIQAFLSLVMSQAQGQSGVLSCAAINIAIRALFTLHWHILNLDPQAVRANFIPLEEWYKRSLGVLDTATKMVVEIAETLVAASPANTATQPIDAMPPMYPYIARAALRHIHSSTRSEGVDCMSSAEDVLQTSLDRYFQRWGVSDGWTRDKTDPTSQFSGRALSQAILC